MSASTLEQTNNLQDAKVPDLLGAELQVYSPSESWEDWMGRLSSTVGTVASLHMHPDKDTPTKSATKSVPMIAVDKIELDTLGIVGGPKRLQRFRRQGGYRQVTMFEREAIAWHATAMNSRYGQESGMCETLKVAGATRANIETTGIQLCTALVTLGATAEARSANASIQVLFRSSTKNNNNGDGVILAVTEARESCRKMDWLYHGLQHSMQPGRQGLCLTCIRGGTIRVGDTFEIKVVDTATITPTAVVPVAADTEEEKKADTPHVDFKDARSFPTLQKGAPTMREEEPTMWEGAPTPSPPSDSTCSPSSSIFSLSDGTSVSDKKDHGDRDARTLENELKVKEGGDEPRSVTTRQRTIVQKIRVVADDPDAKKAALHKLKSKRLSVALVLYLLILSVFLTWLTFR